MAKAVVEALHPNLAAVRYWRVLARDEPQGPLRETLRRAMLAELLLMPEQPPRTSIGDLPTLYLDPLHVLNTTLSARDIVLCQDIALSPERRRLETWMTEFYARALAHIHASRAGIVFTSEAGRSSFKREFGSDFRFLAVVHWPLPVQTRTDKRGATGRTSASNGARAKAGARKQFADSWTKLISR